VVSGGCKRIFNNPPSSPSLFSPPFLPSNPKSNSRHNLLKSPVVNKEGTPSALEQTLQHKLIRVLSLCLSVSVCLSLLLSFSFLELDLFSIESFCFFFRNTRISLSLNHCLSTLPLLFLYLPFTPFVSPPPSRVCLTHARLAPASLTFA